MVEGRYTDVLDIAPHIYHLHIITRVIEKIQAIELDITHLLVNCPTQLCFITNAKVRYKKKTEGQ